MMGGAAITAIFGGDTTELSRKISDLRSKAGGLRAAFAQIGIGLSAGVAIGYFRNLAQELDEVAKTAGRIGVGTDLLQEMRFAGEQTGLSVNEVDLALQRFTRRLGEAQRGGGSLRAVLDQYNIQLKDSSGNTRAMVDILRDFADVLKSVQDPQERLRIAFAAFDSGGTGMINTLRDGALGLDEYRQAARDAGAVIEEDLIRRAEQFNDQWTTLNMRVKSLGSTILGTFLAIGENIGIAAGAMVYGFDAAAESILAEQRRAERELGKGAGADSERNTAADRDAADREREARMKRIQQLQQQFEREARTGLFARIDLEAQRRIVEDELFAIAREQRNLQDDEEAWLENQLQLQQKMNELERIEQRISQQKAQEEQRAAREKLQREREITDELERQKEIRDSIIRDARSELDRDRQARRDAVSASLSELAGGERGTARQQRQAREIQRLEERAARRADRLGFDDPRTQADLARAEAMRRQLDPLSSRDREPFKDIEKFTRETAESVKAIDEKIGALSASLSR